MKKAPKATLSGLGAGDRGRTDTVSLPLDFESSTSANSITPANGTKHIITSFVGKVKNFLKKYALNFFLFKILFPF